MVIRAKCCRKEYSICMYNEMNVYSWVDGACSILFKTSERGRKGRREVGREGGNGATGSLTGSITNLICCFKEHQGVMQQA